MILVLCLVIVITAAFIAYELMEADRRIWHLDEREDWDITPFLRFWKKP